MSYSSTDWSEREIFARGPVVVFRWRNQPGWPVEYVSPNAGEVFGFSPQQFLDGEVVYGDLIHAEDLEQVAAEVEEGSKNFATSFVQSPYRILRADGEIRWLYDMAHIIRETPDGEPTHFLGYVVDITKQIEAENQRHELQLKLLQTQKLESLGILASGVAHDFNNFLTGILGEAELALLNLGVDRDEVERGLRSIDTLATRAAEVTRQLLTYSGKRQDSVRPVKLDVVVREVADMLGTVISSNAVLEMRLDNVPEIIADRTQIVQIAMNLLTNASDSLDGKPGRIAVSVSEVPNKKPGKTFVRLTVTDTGCGMSEDVRARLFDPFFTTKHTGRGLGMSAVQGILRAHGGHIEVESSPGIGSSFHVILPQSPPDAR